MLVRRHARSQTIAAIFGHSQKERPTLLPDGQLSTDANPWATYFHRSACLCEGVSGTESFFEAWRDAWSSWRALFDPNSDSLHEFIRIDPSILRAAAFTDSDKWYTLFPYVHCPGANSEHIYTCMIADLEGSPCGT
eukprot:4193670-Pyramimonas_sp.AAC.2